MRPKGHRNAQMARPSKTPNKRRTPTIYKGSRNLMLPNAPWRVPRGQAAIAPGQEEQLSPGTHKPFNSPLYKVPRTNPTRLALYKRVEMSWAYLRLTNADTLQTNVDCSVASFSKVSLSNSYSDEYYC